MCNVYVQQRTMNIISLAESDEMRKEINSGKKSDSHISQYVLCYICEAFGWGEARDVTYLKPYFVAFTTSARSRATDNPSKFLRNNLI